jgi:predicted transcriptional regulator
MTIDYELIASIRRSTIKKRLLELLAEPKTATDLKKILNIRRESISRALLNLESQRLVTCINPTQPNFRYYKITETGTKILKKLK